MSEVRITKIPRSIKFLQMDDVEARRYLELVETSFGAEFLLDTSAPHRLKELWERTDSNSSIELLSLGWAIEKLQTSSNNWLKMLIKDLKRPDTPALNGPLFELNLLSWLLSGQMTVTPAPYAHKGIDLTIHYSDGTDVQISLKNFDMSAREKAFQGHCELIRAKCREVFPSRGYLGTRIFFTAKDYIGSDDDWKKICYILGSWPRADGVATFTPPDYPSTELGVFSFSSSGANELTSQFNSDEIIAIMPWHHEEHLHYQRKVENAVVDLKNACKGSSELKGVFIRLHQSARIDELMGFAEVATKEQDVDFIMFYQPAYITELSNNTTSPSLYMVYASSERWKQENKSFNFQVLIGTILNKPTKLKLFTANHQLVDMPSNHYFYQKGQHFIQAPINADGSANFNFQRIPNLCIYPVFNGSVVVGACPIHDNFLIL